MDLTVVGNNNNNMLLLRDYRKGNWNLQETMVLIEAKRLDDDRRTRRTGEVAERGKPAELRWKWVEDYCWKKGCLRSQNQCNDKWDNLMRDFKKVRDYENKRPSSEDDKSYWRMEKNERKDNNLPSNMLPEIYEPLLEVVERRGRRPDTAGGSDHAFVNQPPPPLPTVDSDVSEYSGSPAKRRKRRGIGGEGTSGGTTIMGELGSAITKSASTIAEAIQSSEEGEERRHLEVMRVHERRLEIEESKGDRMINRDQGNGLVEAINKLADSIFALAAHNNHPSSSSPSK